MQLRGSFDLIAEHAGDAAAVWDQKARPGVSMPGFVLWHCARIIDWGVHTVVRRVPEVAAGDDWRERIRYTLGHGAGLSTAEAEQLAKTVTPDDVIAYVQALRRPVLDWVARITDDELDEAIDMRAVNATHPRYITDMAWAEVKNLDGVQAWQILARPCISHVRIHIGEVETLSAAVAASVTAS